MRAGRKVEPKGPTLLPPRRSPSLSVPPDSVRAVKDNSQWAISIYVMDYKTMCLTFPIAARWCSLWTCVCQEVCCRDDRPVKWIALATPLPPPPLAQPISPPNARTSDARLALFFFFAVHSVFKKKHLIVLHTALTFSASSLWSNSLCLFCFFLFQARQIFLPLQTNFSSPWTSAGGEVGFYSVGVSH